jgi:hypothetical protein
LGALAAAESVFGRDQHLVAAALDRRAQHLLGGARAVDVGAVEHGKARIQADIDQPLRAFGVGVAPGLEEVALAAESARAEGQDRNLEAGTAEQAIFHDRDPSG